MTGYFETYILEPLSEFGINDVLDILLLTALLFYLYRFIRNRRAGKLALGMLLIIILLVLSVVLNLRAVNFIFQNFYQVGLIAILIVFQPELRAALEKVGNTSIINNIKKFTSGDKRRQKELVESSVDQMLDAVYAMSIQKVGALIVIERATKLGDYISTGTLIDANISSELIKNIFFKNAPLHDGAVIIRDYKVCAAGCFLRISEQEGLDQELGTRHRAALGVSEVSDAAIVVVSEESGKVSYVTDGKMKRGLDRETLRRELVKAMIANIPSTSAKKPNKEVNGNDR